LAAPELAAIFHFSIFNTFKNMSGELPDKPCGSSDEPVPVFIVEKIIGRRLVKSRLEYLVKWEGFSKNENSWEPIENVFHCSDLICSFEAELVRQGKAQEAATNNEPVDKILDKRLVDGCVQYLVKWRGYRKKDNSWETMQALNHCLDLLGDFEAQLMARSQGQEAQLMAPSQDIIVLLPIIIRRTSFSKNLN